MKPDDVHIHRHAYSERARRTSRGIAIAVVLTLAAIAFVLSAAMMPGPHHGNDLAGREDAGQESTN